MLERKAYKELIAWKHSCASRDLLVTGARQVGKAT